MGTRIDSHKELASRGNFLEKTSQKNCIESEKVINDYSDSKCHSYWNLKFTKSNNKSYFFVTGAAGVIILVKIRHVGVGIRVWA